MKLESIAPWEVRQKWPQIAGLLDRVVSSDASDNTLDDVKQFLLSGRMQAWQACDWKVIAVTEIIPYGTDANHPSKLVCNITFCAGDGIEEWLSDIGELEKWARSGPFGIPCTEMRIVGREGWVKALPDYTKSHVTLRKKL